MKRTGNISASLETMGSEQYAAHSIMRPSISNCSITFTSKYVWPDSIPFCCPAVDTERKTHSYNIMTKQAHVMLKFIINRLKSIYFQTIMSVKQVKKQ